MTSTQHGTRTPLAGILVADFSRVLAGPLCTQMLADEGARVIKIEDPERGDETRRWGPPFVNGVSSYFLSVNRGKESAGIDLDSREGRDLAHEIVKAADVVVDNFLPHQSHRFGLADAREINSRIVHCSISGYEPDAPDAGLPGYDLLAQAGAGLMAISGMPEGEPTKVGVAVADILTAHYAHGAICAALLARERTGEGARIEISLFGATLASLVNVIQGALVTGLEAARAGNAHPSIVPYQRFQASDTSFVVGAGTDRHFQQLCVSVLAAPEIAADDRFATNAQRVENRALLVPLLEMRFLQRPAREWVRRCTEHAIPAALVRGPLEAARSDSAGSLVATLEQSRAGIYESIRNPVRLNGELLPLRSAPPELGEHTAAVEREFSTRRAKT